MAATKKHAESGGTDTYELLAEEISLRHVGNRTLSTALLFWFLEAVWRLDPDAASDSICDGGGDKGIDAIYVDDDAREILVFQSKHRKTEKSTQGDNDLKAFVGVAKYFEDGAAVDSLIASKPNQELQKLLARMQVKQKVESGEYSVRLVFVTNAELDSAGQDYIKAMEGQAPALDVWDRKRLAGVAARTAVLRVGDHAVPLSATSPPIVADLDGQVRMAIALVAAPDLVRLPGIEDLSIFELNVRLGLGKTRINKLLAGTIQDQAEHKLFATYHNGMTLLTQKFEVDGSDINLTGVSVVNGCQSLTALYDNRASLTPDLQLLVRIVELGTQSGLVDRITYRTNNQNAVSLRDQRSTDKIQRDLQTQLGQAYPGELQLSIRSGEKLEGEVIENSFLAQLVMATYVGEPWNAVRKVRLFDHEYHRIFSHGLDAHRILLLHELDLALNAVRQDLNPELVAAFSSVRFTLAYLVHRLIGLTDEGERFLDSPQALLAGDRAALREALADLASEAVASVNHFVDAKEQEARDDGRTFDPKVAFKSRTSVTEIERDAVSFANRAMRRDSEYGFKLS